MKACISLTEAFKYCNRTFKTSLITPLVGIIRCSRTCKASLTTPLDSEDARGVVGN